MMTRGVASLPEGELAAVLNAVRTFDAFTQDNDPHGEHDFGKVEVGGSSYFWKIDAYDLQCEFGSEDPRHSLVLNPVKIVSSNALAPKPDRCRSSAMNAGTARQSNAEW